MNADSLESAVPSTEVLLQRQDLVPIGPSVRQATRTGSTDNIRACRKLT